MIDRGFDDDHPEQSGRRSPQVHHKLMVIVSHPGFDAVLVRCLRAPEKGDEILALVHQHKGRSVAVFSSVARSEDTAESDVDLLVELGPTSSLLDLIHVEADLRTLLARSVDVVSVGALFERDDDIRRDAIAR